MSDSYKTIKAEATAELTEKRSRFIASVRPVLSEEEAVGFINGLRQGYWDATHNVYAYIIRENNIMRYSDDGEPSGTAGMPVLDVLKKEGLTNLCIVVTRYFGGILLGTGGLVHAYSKSAKRGIDAAGTAEMVLCRELKIRCSYTMLGKLRSALEKRNVIIGSIAYTDSVVIPLFVPLEEEEGVTKLVAELTNAAAEIERGDEYYRAL